MLITAVYLSLLNMCCGYLHGGALPSHSKFVQSKCGLTYFIDMNVHVMGKAYLCLTNC